MHGAVQGGDPSGDGTGGPGYSVVEAPPQDGPERVLLQARGALREDDLIRVLTERPDVTALLDVTFPEPPADGSALYALENCILTPHIAGSSGNEVHRMSEYMKDEYRRFSSGQKCLYEVTEAMLETMA